jgi:hypothetical protein
MKIKDFIEQNRQELNHAINSEIYRHDGNGGKGHIPEPEPQHNQEQIKQWIMNDEGLYNWARKEGVRI